MWMFFNNTNKNTTMKNIKKFKNTHKNMFLNFFYKNIKQQFTSMDCTHITNVSLDVEF